jgi:hypothetical protein
MKAHAVIIYDGMYSFYTGSKVMLLAIVKFDVVR